jgi:hypothetical protein
MNFKTTAILLVALAGLLGFYFWNQSGTKPVATSSDQTISPTGEGQKMFSFDLIAVDRVSFVTPGGVQTTVQRTGDGWVLTEPIQAPAATQTVITTIDGLLTLRSRGQPVSDPGSESGLDKPSYTVELHTVDGKTSTLAIGNKAGFGDVLYARVDNGSINLIDGDTAVALIAAADTGLRDKHFLTYDNDAIQQLEIIKGTDRLTLGKFRGQWRVLEPQNISVEKGNVNGLLKAIVGIEGTSFLKPDSDELAFARFDQPTVQVRLGVVPPATRPTTSLSDLVLTVGAPDSLLKDHYFARTGDGVIGKVSADDVQELLSMSILNVRTRDVASIAPSDVTRIRIVNDTFEVNGGPGGPATTMPVSEFASDIRRLPAAPQGPSTARPAAQWQFADQPSAQVDTVKVDALLDLFHPLRAQDFFSEPPAGVFENRCTVILTTTSGEFRMVVHLSQNAQPYAEYNGLMFSIYGPLERLIEGDFHQGAG